MGDCTCPLIATHLQESAYPHSAGKQVPSPMAPYTCPKAPPLSPEQAAQSRRVRVCGGSSPETVPWHCPRSSVPPPLTPTSEVKHPQRGIVRDHLADGAPLLGPDATGTGEVEGGRGKHGCVELMLNQQSTGYVSWRGYSEARQRRPSNDLENSRHGRMRINAEPGRGRRSLR